MTLEPADVEAIAERIVELIERPRTAPPYIDAAELARRLGVRRSWVYEHARLLGAIRLGGSRGRLRFDAEAAASALKQAADREPKATTEKPSGRPPRRVARGVDLLPF